RERREGELVLRLEDALERDPEPEKNGRQPEDAHQLNGQAVRVVIEVEERRRDRSGQGIGDGAGDEDGDAGPGQDGRREPGRPVAVAPIEESAKDWDEGSAERAGPDGQEK